MISPYLLRLLCLCSATFFLVHTALGLAAWLAAPRAIRLAQGMQPRLAVRFLFALRLAPVGLAVLAVLGLCVPSYLWLEPDSTVERVGLTCLAMAFASAAIWGMAILRVVRAIAASIHYARQCRRAGQKIHFAGDFFPVLVIEEKAPLLALAGVIRPQLVISRGVMQALSVEELDAALRHENAHRISRDNLKRFLFLLAPEVFPFSRCFAALERSWARLTEWATDDCATAGDPRRALSLAGALVRIARMGAAPRLSSILSSLVADHSDLSARVDRLLRAEHQTELHTRRMPAFAAGAAFLAGTIVTVMLCSATLSSVHELLEQLLR